MNFTPIITANAAVQLHIAAVLIAIGAALFIFATAKGSHTHKIVGRIGALALIIAALSSFGINSFSDPYFGLSAIHLFSCMVLVFIPYGVIQVRKGNISAHRKAMRLSHRLLLILHPATPQDAGAAAALAAERDFSVLNWGNDGFPDESTQVLIADDTRDLGLFFRIAPVSFLGSSVIAGEGGCDPFDAAALGSAVLYGPKVRHFMPSYTRLAAAGAARIVNDADALGTAVSRLIAPDQAAAMAHAGWDVISKGAAVTDKITDLIQDILDTREAGK